MFVQVSGIIYSNIYRADDAPDCEFSSLDTLHSCKYPSLYFSPECYKALTTADRRGNRQLVAICAANIVIYGLAKAYYIWRNKSREKEWSAMTRDVSPVRFGGLLDFQSYVTDLCRVP